MILSIVVCTYNNYDLLESCLKNLNALGYDIQHEVLIVDNSTDVEGKDFFLKNVFPKYSAKYVESFPAGLSRARNVGYKKAQGDIIAYIDDDSFPKQGWDKAIIASFKDTNVGIAGGPVNPLWETQRPHWLPHEFIGAYTVVDLGFDARILSENEMLVGANMAFRRNVLLASKGFDENLGRVGGNLLSNEETKLIKELRTQWQCYYHPHAAVDHFVKEERITQQWLLSRMAWQGFSDLYSSDDLFEGKKSLCLTLENDTLKNAVQELLVPAVNKAEMQERLYFARYISEFLFNSKRANDVSRFDSMTRQDIVFAEMLYKPQVLFVEFATHAYLYNGYASEPQTALVKKDVLCWEQQYEYLRHILAVFDAVKTHNIEHLVFMTISPLFSLSAADLDVLTQRGSIRLSCFLHQDLFGKNAIQLPDIALYFEKIFVFHDIIRSVIIQKYPMLASKIFVMPHPFTCLQSYYEKFGVKKRVPKANGKISLGFLGGFREGKGFSECATMIAKLPKRIRDSIHCIFAGGVSDLAFSANIEATLDAHRVSNEFRVGQRGTHQNDYKGISEVEYANALLDTDILMLPYYGAQANAFSGNFSDALVAGSVIMANQGCLMADVIEAEGLGMTFSLDDQKSFEDAIIAAIDAVKNNELYERQKEFLENSDILCLSTNLLQTIISKKSQ